MGQARLGYGQLEEDILRIFHPYKDMPEDCTAEQMWQSTPLHERTIDQELVNKSLDRLMQAEQDNRDRKKRESEQGPKTTIKKTDLDRFVEETGLKPFQAEEYFVLAEGNLEEALMIWTHQVPGQQPMKLSEYTNTIRLEETRRTVG